jgi:LytS/YehU family sensor histidine kinase
VPSLFLQMVLENVVSYGLAAKVGPGRVEVEVSVNQRRCWLRIQDDGPTWRERAERAGAGLRRVKERLAAHYARRYSFSIRKARRFAVEIRIPRGHPDRASSHRPT